LTVAQTERERRVKEKREARMMDRQLRRRQEYVRRCRLLIEERRRKVRRPCLSESLLNGLPGISS